MSKTTETALLLSVHTLYPRFLLLLSFLCLVWFCLIFTRLFVCSVTNLFHYKILQTISILFLILYPSSTRRQLPALVLISVFNLKFFALAIKGTTGHIHLYSALNNFKKLGSHGSWGGLKHSILYE